MLVNNVKKGARVQLRNGWYGTMADNAKGQIRMVRVEGYATETGSVYAKDIIGVEIGGGVWEPVTLSPAQAKRAQVIKAAGF